MEVMLGWLIELLTFDLVKIDDIDEKSQCQRRSKHKKVRKTLCRKVSVISSSDGCNENLLKRDNDDKFEHSDSNSNSNNYSINDQVASSESSSESLFTWEESLTNASSSSSSSSSSSETFKSSITKQIEEHKVEQIQCTTLLHKENENEQLLSTPPTTLPHNPSWQSNEDNESARAKPRESNKWALQYSFDNYDSYTYDDMWEGEFNDNFLCKSSARSKEEEKQKEEEYCHQEWHSDLDQVNEGQIYENITSNSKIDAANIKSNEFLKNSVNHTAHYCKEKSENITNSQKQLFDVTDTQVITNIIAWHENEEANNNLIKSSVYVNTCLLRQEPFGIDENINKTNDNTNHKWKKKSRETARSTDSFDSNSSTSSLSNKTSCCTRSTLVEQRHLLNISSSRADCKVVLRQMRAEEDCVLHGHNTNMALISWTLSGPETFTPHAFPKCKKAEHYHQSYKNKIITAYLDEVEPPMVEMEPMASSLSLESSSISEEEEEELQLQEENDYSDAESEDVFADRRVTSRRANENKQSSNNNNDNYLQCIQSNAERFGNQKFLCACEEKDSASSKEQYNENIKNDLQYKKSLQEEWLSANNKNDTTEHTFVNQNITAPVVFQTEQREQRKTCYTNLNRRRALNDKNDCNISNNNNSNIVCGEENLILPIMTSLNGLKKSFYGETIGTPVASVHPVRDISILDLESVDTKQKYNLKQGQDCCLEEVNKTSAMLINKLPIQQEEEQHIQLSFLSSASSAISSPPSSSWSRALYSSHSVEETADKDEARVERREEKQQEQFY